MKRSTLVSLAFAVVLASTASARAAETAEAATAESSSPAAPVEAPEGAMPARVLQPRDAAIVGARGDYSVGVFNPLTYNILDGVALRVHPLVFFAAPHVLAEVSHGTLGPLRLKGEYGLSLPTPGMRLLQGYLFPTWDESDRKVGWFLVPRAGLTASWGPPAEHVITGRVDMAYGIPLGRNDARPLGGVAPLELLFAPVLSTYRARAGIGYDRAIMPWLRVRAGFDAWLHGRNPSPVTLGASLGVDIAVGESSRVTAGAMWWNADTGAIDAETHERVRSNDFFPTLDFIWAG